jgi:uncharacterized protein (TIGR02246 family)
MNNLYNFRISSGEVFMPSDEIAIQDIIQHFETAWNCRDSQAVAALFAADATLIQIFGRQFDGRKAIEASHRHLFDTIYRGSRLTFFERSIRFVRADVAIVFARGNLSVIQAHKVLQMETRPTLTLVKAEAQWQIVAFQNTRITRLPAAAHAAASLAS